MKYDQQLFRHNSGTNNTPLEIYSVATLSHQATNNWYKLPDCVINAYEHGEKGKGVVFTDKGIYIGEAFGSKEDFLVYDTKVGNIYFITENDLKTNFEIVDSAVQKNMNEPQTQAQQVLSPEHQANMAEANDKVNHPSHYNVNPQFETIKVLKAWLTPEQYEGFLIGNSLKYQSRYKFKNGIEDLKKSNWYLTELRKEYEEGYFKK